MNNEKFYLGISLGFNSSACVFSSERGLLAAISQERLNGEKNTKELPFDAMIECVKLAGTDVIDSIAISHYENITDYYFKRYGSRYKLTFNGWEDAILSYLRARGITVRDNRITRVNHHEAHALSTFGFYGIPTRNFYTITCDGFGDGLSARIKFGQDVIDTMPLRDSIALVYQFVTGALGFKEHQHEGKITGLAAFGKPIYLDKFNNIDIDTVDLTDVERESVNTSQIIDFADFLKLKKYIYSMVEQLIESGAKREDIAASVQEYAEIRACEWIRKNCLVKGASAYLAGGLFANVKINQRIKDLGIFNEVYVCPAMGDEGTAVGAAIYLATMSDDCIFDEVNNKVNVGTKPNVDDVLKAFNDECENKANYVIRYLDNSIDYIAKKLADNKIVCLKRDRMEFGPRALCHTSILYNADSRETNDWLNKKLSRTEFMPFAPVCREEVADDLFINLDGGRTSAKYMTMTFDCTPEFAENYKAACHIDNTARPQIVSKEDDVYMWEILRKYQILTGKKAMINTSFNLHNNPIIESVETAVSSWLKSDTDVLVIENIAIEKR